MKNKIYERSFLHIQCFYSGDLVSALNLLSIVSSFFMSQTQNIRGTHVHGGPNQTNQRQIGSGQNDMNKSWTKFGVAEMIV